MVASGNYDLSAICFIHCDDGTRCVYPNSDREPKVDQVIRKNGHLVLFQEEVLVHRTRQNFERRSAPQVLLALTTQRWGAFGGQ
jgi:hypothetical protein